MENFKLHTKKLGINLTKYVQSICAENHKTLVKEINKDEKKFKKRDIP